MKRTTLTAATLVLVAAGVVGGCRDEFRPTRVVANADTTAGKERILHYGCGSCHEIPGVKGARGLVGPPLTKFGRRGVIAGELKNTPDNLIRWIQDPREVEPKTDMPDLGVKPEEARDIAAYLERLG